jgi:Spy/CpxP family protein refolding chaperone
MTKMTKTFLAATVVAAGFAAAVPYVGSAQDRPAAQAEHRGRGGRGPGGPGGFGGGPMGFGEVMRDLTDAQREQIKAIRERHAETMKPLAERTRVARQALDNAIMSGDTSKLQALSLEAGNAETELIYAQAQVQSEIYKVLTAEQKQKIAERRKQMEARRGEMQKRREGRTQ